jgi:MFS transporter, DHA1 family, multidrug resistance protein
MADRPRRQFVRLCVAGGFAYGSYAMCRAPVLPLLARSLGAPPEVVGVVVGASTLTGVLLKLPAGALSDVLGRRTLLLTGALIFALVPFGYVAVGTLALLIVLRVVHGGATAIFSPVASAAISDLAPASMRGRWLGTYSAVQGTGQAVGPVLAGYLLLRHGFPVTFAASGCAGVLALAIMGFWPRDVRSTTPSNRWRQLTQGIREVSHDRRTLTVSFAQAGQFVLNGSLNGFLPLFAVETLGLTPFQAGLAFGTQTLTTLLARPMFGMLSDRVGRRPLILAGLACCGAAVWGVSVAEGMASVAIACAAYGAGLAVTTSATTAAVTDLTRRIRYGAAHGVFGTIYDIGDALGPIVAGVIVGAVGYRPMFRAAAVTAIVTALVFWRLSRSWEPTPDTTVTG